MSNSLYEQIDLFSFTKEKYVIDKPVLLIEFFGGIGSQAKALEVLGIPFKHHKLVEWAYNSYVMYNLIHQKDKTDYSDGKTKEEMIERIKGTSTNYNEPLTIEQLNKKPISWIKNAYNSCIATNNLVDIQRVKGRDLDFNDNKNQIVIATYSFPCQDLSLAGQLKGATKGSGTRSGLLWEVERILDERVKEDLPLPNVLLMENVANLLSQNFIKDFQAWEQKLATLGYQNFIKVLNAKNYGIPQNRKRVFMVSILGNYHYDFPLKCKLENRLEYLLSKNVDKNYYLDEKTIERISSWNGYEKPLENIVDPSIDNTISTLTTHCGKDSNGMKLIKVKNNTKTLVTSGSDKGVIVIGNYMPSGHNSSRVIDTSGIAPTVMENHGTITAIPTNDSKIRKLTSLECFKLMGFSQKDWESVKEQFGDSAIYHVAGDSIVTTCLISLFGTMTNLDYRKIIKDYTNTLKGDYV